MKNLYLLFLLPTQTHSLVAAPQTSRCRFSCAFSTLFLGKDRGNIPLMLSLGGGSAWITCVPGGGVSGGQTQALLGGAKKQVKRQGAETDTQEIPPKYEEKNYCVNDCSDWNMVPTEVVGSPSLKKVGKCPDAVLCHVLWDDTA